MNVFQVLKHINAHYCLEATILTGDVSLVQITNYIGVGHYIQTGVIKSYR